MSKLSNWVKTLSGVKVAIAGKLVIGGKEYPEACYYKRTFSPLEGSRNKQDYERELIIVLGAPPKHETTAFSMKDENGRCTDTNEWYVCSFLLEKNITDKTKELHPCGASFQVAPWNIDVKIDDGMKKPYKRVDMRWVPTV